MSCDSPFEYLIIEEPWIEYEYCFQMNGVCKIPALTIPSWQLCLCDWTPAHLDCPKCYWTTPVCKTEKTCWLGICTTTKTCKVKWWDCPPCNWVKGTTTYYDCWTVQSITLFPAISIPMTANIPFVVSSGIDYIVDDLGVQQVQVAEYTIYQNHEINGVSQTFKLSFNFGSGLIFDFLLPDGFSCTVMEANGDFSVTVPLYDFGELPPYKAVTGYTYTLTMSINLLFCLGEEAESWINLQVVSETEITGNDITPYKLPINFTIPLASE